MCPFTVSVLRLGPYIYLRDKNELYYTQVGGTKSKGLSFLKRLGMKSWNEIMVGLSEKNLNTIYSQLYNNKRFLILNNYLLILIRKIFLVLPHQLQISIHLNPTPISSLLLK